MGKRNHNCNWGIASPTWKPTATQNNACFPASIGRLEQKCLQLTMKSSGQPQHLQFCWQPVTYLRCGDRESPVTDSSMCPLATLCHQCSVERRKFGNIIQEHTVILIITDVIFHFITAFNRVGACNCLNLNAAVSVHLRRCKYLTQNNWKHSTTAVPQILSLIKTPGLFPRQPR